MSKDIPNFLLQQMLACSEGEPSIWRDVSLALRDAVVDHAKRNCPHHRDRLAGCSSFEEIPILTKADIRNAGDAMLAKNLPPSRRHCHQTSGSSGDPMQFVLDTAWNGLVYAAREFLETIHKIPKHHGVHPVPLTPA